MADHPPLAATDVSRPSALPTASLSNLASQVPHSQLDAAEYLDAVQEDLNKRVDNELEVLVDGMVDLVQLAAVRDKDKFRVAHESFQIEMRAESMIRAAHSLLSITHSLKLVHLLSDESQLIKQKDAQLRSAQADTKEYKDKVAALLDELLLSRRS